LSTAPLYVRISETNAGVLIDHLDYFSDQCDDSFASVSVTIVILLNVALQNPNAVFPHAVIIKEKALEAHAECILIQLLVSISKATEPKNATNVVFSFLIEILEGITEDDNYAADIFFAMESLFLKFESKEFVYSFAPILFRCTKWAKTPETVRSLKNM
jgi:hypothetical protein